jgi:hypothetical protein
MHTLMLGEIVGSMEALLTNLTIEFLLSLVLPRVAQPIIFSYESLSACIASESVKKENEKIYLSASPCLYMQNVYETTKKRITYGLIDR